MAMKKIALFGGTGYVGSRLCELLLETGVQVRMLVRDAEKSSEYQQKEGTEVVEGELPDYEAIKHCIEDTDAVLVATGQRGRSRQEMQTLVEGNRNIIKAMEDRGVNSLIKISGTSVLLPGESSPLMRRLLDIAFRVLLSNPTRCEIPGAGRYSCQQSGLDHGAPASDCAQTGPRPVPGPRESSSGHEGLAR
ncbi:MAG: NAD(P)-dependent oxidoreductase [Porticoccaceae bacterium]